LAKGWQSAPFLVVRFAIENAYRERKRPPGKAAFFISYSLLLEYQIERLILPIILRAVGV
jgi:hypothetical protein